MASAMMLALRNLSAMGLCRSGRWLAPSALKVVRQISSSSSSSSLSPLAPASSGELQWNPLTS